MSPSAGVVVIGRNEGERLRRCLASLGRSGLPVVYVDSASTDSSRQVARESGVHVVELDESAQLSAARARNEGRGRRTHTTNTLRARRDGRHERSGRHTSNLYATARLQIAPSPDRGAGDGTAFSLTATARPLDGGTVAAVYTWNSQSMDGPGVRPKGGPLHKGPRSRVRVAIQRLVLETQSRPETIHAQVQRGYYLLASWVLGKQ